MSRPSGSACIPIAASLPAAPPTFPWMKRTRNFAMKQPLRTCCVRSMLDKSDRGALPAMKASNTFLTIALTLTAATFARADQRTGADLDRQIQALKARYSVQVHYRLNPAADFP